MNLTQVVTGTWKVRPYCPGTWYHGDRPNLFWPAFLMRLQPHLHPYPRLRPATRRIWDGVKAKWIY